MRRLIIFGAPLLLAASLAASASGGGPLKTAVVQPSDLRVADAPLIFSRIRGAGASLTRVTLDWYAIAPKELPASFDPENPSDPAYDWTDLDAIVKAAFAEGVEPYLAVNSTPVWARIGQKGGGAPPIPADFAKFMHAAALRYSGAYPGLPRIRYWQIWIEPNVNRFFRPQLENGKPVAPKRYAAIVNAAADAIHAVRGRQQGDRRRPLAVHGHAAGDTSTIGPMAFMREMLCMNAKNKPRASCCAPRPLRHLVAPPVHERRADAPRVQEGRRLARRPAAR